jgi:putative membrane protein
LIPLAWLMMLPAAWAVASVITDSHRGWRFVLVSALALTAWDCFLDPQMVSWGYWVWATPGGYFGIPWINFAGWALSAGLLTLLARPLPLPIPPLLAIYTITWALQSTGQLFFWQMPGPALSGFIAMGLFVCLAWREHLLR